MSMWDTMPFSTEPASILPGLAEILLGDVGAEVHGRGVVPEEERFVRLGLRLHPGEGPFGDLLVDRFHALLGKRPRVLDLLLPHAPPARVLGGVVDVGR